MPVIGRGTLNYVESYNGSNGTAITFQGAGLPPIYLNCNFGVQYAVMNNLDVYIAFVSNGNNSLTSNSIQGPPVAGTYTGYNAVALRDFSAYYSGPNNGATIINNGQDSGTVWSFYASGGLFTGSWRNPTTINIGDANPPSYMVKVGNLANMSNPPGQPQDGYIWIAGTTNYNVTAPLIPEAQRFLIPGILLLKDYFPWSVRSQGAWESCNRPSASLDVRENGAWRNVKNIESDSTNSKGHHRENDAWVVTPKTGANG